MSEFIRNLVTSIEYELLSVSPTASLDNVFDEVTELIDTIKNNKCDQCNLNVGLELNNSEPNKYKELFLACCKYIDETPCDPDITQDQLVAYNELYRLLKKHDESIKGVTQYDG